MALIVAETRAQALDAAEQVAVDYVPLSAVTTTAAARARGAPELAPAVPGNLCLDWQIGDPAEGYTLRNGVAPEYIVALANELHADAWISIPHMAQDDYVSGVATLVHNTLNPGQHVYLAGAECS